MPFLCCIYGFLSWYTPQIRCTVNLYGYLIIHPSIYYLHCFTQGCRKAVANSSWLWVGDRIYSGQGTNTSHGTKRQPLTLTPLGTKLTKSTCFWTVGGNWRTLRNQHRQKKNMQTPQRKASALTGYQTWNYKMTVLTITALFQQFKKGDCIHYNTEAAS